MSVDTCQNPSKENLAKARLNEMKKEDVNRKTGAS